MVPGGGEIEYASLTCLPRREREERSGVQSKAKKNVETLTPRQDSLNQKKKTREKKKGGKEKERDSGRLRQVMERGVPFGAREETLLLEARKTKHMLAN